MKRTTIGVGAAAVVLILTGAKGCGSSSSSSGAKTTTTVAAGGTAAPTSVAPKSSTYTVGQTAKTGGFDITVYAFKDPQPPADQFSTPDPGMQFVSVDVQVMNPSSSQQTFSSLNGFHLLDSANHQYDESLGGAGLTPDAPDGQIAAGQAIRGFVVFEVPTSTPAAGLKFRAQGSFTASGAVWQLS